MQKPPTKKALQTSWVHTAVRLPPELRDEIKDAADRNGHSMNAEIVARLSAAPQDAKLDAITKTVTKIEKIVKELIEK